MSEAAFTIHENLGYRYLDEGSSDSRPPIVLLHGMLGDLSNWSHTVDVFARKGYRVLVPILPVYDLPLKETSITGLVDYVRGLLGTLQVQKAVLVGNSLGGHVALVYTLFHPRAVSALVLSGSSGIYEVEMGSGTPRRRDREFIRERAAVTFYDPSHATEELVDEMFDIVNDRARVVRLIKMARSAKTETVTDRLASIDVPTLLVWGRNDTITPPEVAHTFHDRLPRAELHFIDECGHAPMIEHPEAFNKLMLDFLRKTVGPSPLAFSDTP